MKGAESIDSGTLVAAFRISYHRCLDGDGRWVANSKPGWDADANVLVPLYRTMVLTRQFDKSALVLQRTGRLGTYASPLGQEAIGAAVASVMQPVDVLLPSYREFSAQLHRGVTVKELLQYWGGDERGSDFQNCREDFPVCVPIATQALHAAGVASAFVYRKQPRVAVCFLGDGATSKGDFYEATNLAGVWRLPIVFVISNNAWAISVPRTHQTAAQTLAQKAIASGFKGEQVDGNDAIAMRWAAERALDAARAGHGPRLIEAITYRMSDHTTADDASRYRDEALVARHSRLDPLRRLRNYLTDKHLWSDDKQKALDAWCDAEIEGATQEYLAMPPQPVTSMFDYLFEKLPETLKDQRAQALRFSELDSES